MMNPYSTPGHQGLGQSPVTLAQNVRQVQIITLALAAGVLAFMGVCLVINNGVMGQQPELLSWIAIGFAALMFVNHLVIPGIVAKAALKSVSAEEVRAAEETKTFDLVFPAFRIRQIIACALLEGGAMVNVIAYMITGYAGNLVTACVQVTMIVIRFPTTTRVQFWVQDRIREIEMS